MFPAATCNNSSYAAATMARSSGEALIRWLMCLREVPNSGATMLVTPPWRWIAPKIVRRVKNLRAANMSIYFDLRTFTCRRGYCSVNCSICLTVKCFVLISANI